MYQRLYERGATSIYFGQALLRLKLTLIRAKAFCLGSKNTEKILIYGNGNTNMRQYDQTNILLSDSIHNPSGVRHAK